MADLVKLALILGVLDYSYIYNIKNYFNNMIISIQGKEMNIKYLGVMLAYVFLFIILKLFVIDNKLSIINSFILGMSIYGVYDMTNYATISNWDFNFVILDTLWGGTLFALINFIYNKLTIYEN
tara:strand:+ start:166 stop:537 length:372 start_codon:yes stop_codon:yes gene_type:complete